MTSLWIDFVNSLSHDALGRVPDRDRLLEADWVRRFVETWKLPRIDGRSV